MTFLSSISCSVFFTACKVAEYRKELDDLTLEAKQLHANCGSEVCVGSGTVGGRA